MEMEVAAAVEIGFAGRREIAETLVCCNRGIFSDNPDKVGSVFILAGSGREVLSLVEQAGMLHSEYPEDCLEFDKPFQVESRFQTRSFNDIVLLVAKNGGQTLVASGGLDRRQLKDALKRLKRYATRLIRMDVP
jgi:hypothetical protein